MAKLSLIGAALRYAARGWYVFPLEAGGKRPYFELLPLSDPAQPRSKTNTATFRPFAANAATSEQIEKWWKRAPDANIGLICSYSTGLVVVDIDPNKRDKDNNYVLPDERRQAFLSRDGFEHTPLVVKTASGGWHLYYRHPRIPAPIVTQKNHSKGKGVDVQGGQLAYVVAPPSIFNGKRYKWHDDSDETAKLPPAPVWLIAPQDTSDTRVFTDHWFSEALLTDVLEGSSDGTPGRARTIRSLALSLAKKNLELDRTTAILENFNELRCKPPLSAAAVVRNTTHMYMKAAKDMGEDGSDRVRLRYNGPPFPFKILKDAAPRLYRWVQAMTARGAHPDMAACAGILGMASAASYYRIKIEGVPEWRPPAHLWGTIVADSGTMKSAVYGKIAEALQPTKDALAHVADIFNATVDTEREILDQIKRSAKAKLSRKPDDVNERQRLIDANLELRRLPGPLPSSWTSSDITAEKFQVNMAALGWVGLLSEEGADVFKGFFGHYSGKNDLSGVLKGYDLGSAEIDRIGRGYTSIPESRASMLIFTQPSVIAGLDHTEAEDRGFLARMQFCIPDNSKRQHLPPVDGDPAEVYRDFERMMLGVYYGGKSSERLRECYDYKPEYVGISFDEDDDEPIQPQRTGLKRPTLRHEIEVLVPTEVWAIIEQFQKEMIEVSGVGSAHHVAQSWCKKAGEHALRMAVVIELAESDGVARELTTDKALAAISLIRDYFLYQYYVAVDRMSRPRVAGMAIHVLKRFQDAESFTTAELADDLRCATEDAVELCRWLADRGAISTKGRGRNLECKVLPRLDY